MNDVINIQSIIYDNIPTLDTWVEETEYEYDIRRSEVIDYCNTIINEEKLDRISQAYDPETKITAWDELYNTCDINPDSSEASTMEIFLSANISLYQDLKNEVVCEDETSNDN